jgi:ABC-type antimicrobial peptide transport system permease subunit
MGFKTQKGVEIFSHDSTICEILFNRNHFTNQTIRILNDEDYEKLRWSVPPENVGEIHLLDFDNWYNTEEIAEELDLVLKEHNKSWSKTRILDNYSAEEYLFESVSRIQTFRQQKQEGGVFLLVWGFIGLLFFMSSGSVLYFKLYTEIDDVKKKYKKIFNIGIRDREIKKILSKELKLIFFTPPLLGCTTGFAMVYVLSANSSIQKDLTTGAAIIVLLYLIFQLFYYLVAKKKYIDAIIESI